MCSKKNNFSSQYLLPFIRMQLSPLLCMCRVFFCIFFTIIFDNQSLEFFYTNTFFPSFGSFWLFPLTSLFCPILCCIQLFMYIFFLYYIFLGQFHSLHTAWGIWKKSFYATCYHFWGRKLMCLYKFFFFICE